jgi:hypothetical protein
VKRKSRRVASFVASPLTPLPSFDSHGWISAGRCGSNNADAADLVRARAAGDETRH